MPSEVKVPWFIKVAATLASWQYGQTKLNQPRVSLKVKYSKEFAEYMYNNFKKKIVQI